MEFINWGNESAAQLEARQRAEREWQALVEQALNLRRQQSQSTAGAVGGGSISITTCNPLNGITILVLLEPEVTGINGTAKIFLQYDGLYNDKESFLSIITPDDGGGYLVRFNSDNNLWELELTGVGVIAQSSQSPYSGWVTDFPPFISLSVECGNTSIRNICLTTTDGETTYRYNSFEIVTETTPIYIFNQIFVGFDAGAWYLFAGEDALELGGDINNFPYGSYSLSGIDFTFTEGFCQI